MLLKRRASHSFPCLSGVVQTTAEPELPGSPQDLTPDPHPSDPDCCGDERVSREMCPQTPTPLRSNSFTTTEPNF